MPLPERACKRLVDVLEAGHAIESFVSGLSFEEFAASALIRSAVERQFEIIGEALGRAAAETPELEQAVPDIPRIVGLRNRLIHGYDSVDDQIVWDLVKHKLPGLVQAVSRLLDENG